MRSAFSRPIIALAMLSSSCLVAGCSSADNPKLPNVPPSTAPPDTSVPKAAGKAEPYGASKRYQDSMPK